MKIALVRGAFLNQYEGQLYYPLLDRHEIMAFCSKHPIHDQFPFPVVKLASPMDLAFGPMSRLKMPILNRLFIDAHWLMGLEKRLDGYDIAHCADIFYHFSHQCVMAKRQGRVKKVVATVFENIPFNNEGICGRKRFKREVIEGVDRFIAISERSKAALMLEGTDENKISVVGQRIDTKRFKPVKRDFYKKKITILFTGRLEFYKGVYEIIYSAKRLLSDPDLKEYKLRFVLVGDGGEKAKLETLIERLSLGKNVIIMSAEYGKMTSFYDAADIFVAPSRATSTYQEQFSTVLLEAQASGLPIVTTYSGGIPENVEGAALMANPGDFYSISGALKKLILNGKLRKSLGEEARKHSLKYDVRLGAKEIERIYEEVLSS
jgi:glycosyltransferase involved in cell wall biosynthesis